MRFLLGFFITLLLTFLLYLFLPWWWWSGVAVAALVGLALQMNSWLSFFCGLLTLALFWGGMAFLLESPNEALLATKMASIVPVGSVNNIFIVVISIGGLLGGLGMLSGKLLRDLITGPQKPTKKR